MNVDKIADEHLKQHGLALGQDDELRLVAKLVDAAVKEHIERTGGNAPPAPISKADMKALAEIMAKCAYEAVSAQMSDMQSKLEIMSDQLAFVTNAICKIQAERAKTEQPKRKILGIL